MGTNHLHPAFPPSAKTIAELMRLLRAGCYLKHACREVRLNYRTVQNWLERGEAGEEPYAEFATDVLQALSTYVNELQGVLRAGNTGKEGSDWRAAAHDLERRDPKLYGDRKDIEAEIRELMRKLEDGLDAATYAKVVQLAGRGP